MLSRLMDGKKKISEDDKMRNVRNKEEGSPVFLCGWKSIRNLVTSILKLIRGDYGNVAVGFSWAVFFCRY